MFIGVVGCIGVGKSYLTAALAERLGYRAYFEPVKENPYLDDYYADPKRYACIMQFFMLTQRFKQHLEIQDLRRRDIGVIQDQIIYGDTIYAKLNHYFGHMDNRDYGNYDSHWKTLEPLLQIPDVVIHLDSTVDTALKRISERGRESEQAISRDYLEKLCELFTHWTNSVQHRTKLIRLDWNAFRPVEDVVTEIEQQLNVQLPLRVVQPVTTN